MTFSALVQNLTQHRNVLRFPSDEDLNGAAVALMRLQDTYKLDTHALAEGMLLGKKYSRHLTGMDDLNFKFISISQVNICIFFLAGDCFELGRQSYNNADHYHTVLWMVEALNKYELEANKTITRQEILEYLAFSTYMQGNKLSCFVLYLFGIFIVDNCATGNLKEALHLTNELLELVPYHQRALGNKKYYTDMLRDQGMLNQRGETGRFVSSVENMANCLFTVKLSHSLDSKPVNKQFSTVNLQLKKPSDNLPERDSYEMLCRYPLRTFD